MTTLLAYNDPENKCIWLGADRAVSLGNERTLLADGESKILQYKAFHIACCGNLRSMQLLEEWIYHEGQAYSVSICPSRLDLVQLFSTYRAWAKNNGLRVEAEDLHFESVSGAFLVVASGLPSIYTAYSDGSVLSQAVPYAALGSGAPYAMGALHALQDIAVCEPTWRTMSVQRRCQQALLAAAAHDSGTSGTDLISVPWKLPA